MSEKLQILILSDSKPGHENQSLGLAEAMGRLRDVEISVLRVNAGKNVFSRTRAALRDSVGYAVPDYVISAGHATHVPLLMVARKYKACSIVLMRPSLPLSWFGWCIAPEHDFPDEPKVGNVLTSKGALNRVRAGGGERGGRLFLIGGPSKTHGYDEEALMGQIREISASRKWQLADSRRTPASLLARVREELPEIEVFPHEETEPGWLAGKLAELEEIQVTEDSVSMIYEALSSGARVGVLEMPRLRKENRVIRGLEKLRAEGYFSADGEGAPMVLAEADRCAAVILAKK